MEFSGVNLTLSNPLAVVSAETSAGGVQSTGRLGNRPVTAITTVALEKAMLSIKQHNEVKLKIRKAQIQLVQKIKRKYQKKPSCNIFKSYGLQLQSGRVLKTTPTRVKTAAIKPSRLQLLLTQHLITKRKSPSPLNVASIQPPSMEPIAGPSDLSLSKKFSCTQCSFKTNKWGALETHMRRHTGEKPYKCSHCEYATSDSSNLHRHSLKHGEKNIKCPQCEYATYETGLLTSHMNSVHHKIKNHSCQEKGCAFKGRTPSELKLHMNKHTGNKPFKCSQCDKTFTSPQAQKKHKSVHLDTKPFICTHCAQTFRLKGNLTAHIKRMHKNQ